jgi:mannitol/fructose-specific phosphotransferase system IIA component (Ntr-type)
MLRGPMRLSDLFPAEDVLVHFEPTDKWDAIQRLVSHLVERGRIPRADAPTIVDAVLARERSMSTGMEHGIAIPHAAVDGVQSVVACMGIVSSGSGLAFESIDGKPARVVVLLVIPRAQKLLHIRTLADIARVLGRDVVREALLNAPDAASAWAALAEGEAARR